ncbi:MAG: urease accessory protein UreE [Pseudomonadota bacterium]
MTAIAHVVRRAGSWQGPPSDHVVLSYADRLLRRRRLYCASGAALLVDLAETLSLVAGDAFETGQGNFVEIAAAEEPLAEIHADGATLVRLAWHIGNRHTPAEITPGRIRIARDHVIEDMLARLGATVAHVTAPFSPEGGAYGTGRVMGHDHGHTPEHGHVHHHGQAPEHGHTSEHGHSHEHGHGSDADRPHRHDG